jgi:plasmid stabilization system protein ParE
VKRVDIQRLAEQDLFNAIDYYVENAPRVGDRFQAAIDRTMELIGRSPRSGSLSLADTFEIEGLRYRVVKSFPYSVFYQELDARVIVLRVLHHGRDAENLL